MDKIDFAKEMDSLNYGKLKGKKSIISLEREIEFTKTYMAHKESAPYILEAECIRKQASLIMIPIKDEDFFAGTLDRMYVGIDPERGDGCEAAFFCSSNDLNDELNNPNTSQLVKDDINFLVEYWKNEATYHKCRAAFPEHIQKGIPGDEYYKALQVSFPMFGLGGPALDFEKLVTLGIPGLQQLVEKRKERALKENETDTSFYDAMLVALGVFIETADRYAKQALSIANETNNFRIKNKLTTIADDLQYIIKNKPSTFSQGIQLVWLYSLLSLVKNYGRMDIYLGDLLANDIKNEIITKEEALDITVGLWQKIVERGDFFNNRIIIGGRGRRNEKNADSFAMIALEAQKIVNHAIPQLSVRWHDGMNKDIWDKSFEVLATGSTMPILYNDDVNVNGMMKAMNVPYNEAEDYGFYGCGEFLIDHKAIASPDAAINMLKALDVTLRNGIDSFTSNKIGLDLGNLTTYKTFEELRYAVLRQIEYQLSMLADVQSINYRVTGEIASFPYLSMLYDDCIERGKPLLSGGAKYLSGVVESFGNNSAADSLYAIKKLVYDDKLITAERMLECLDKNFEGCKKEHKMMLNISKYGNDNTEADDMSTWFNETVFKITQRQKDYTPLDSFLIVLVNNGDNVMFGKATGASADGRRKGEPVTNGNQPTAGRDTNGATALLNSMAKLSPEFHAGVTNNIKFSRTTLQQNSVQIKALIRAFFKNGGTQIMVTSTDAGELENAQKEPEKYSHIFVRVGGYSERFINLSKDVQQEIIKRTLYI